MRNMSEDAMARDIVGRVAAGMDADDAAELAVAFRVSNSSIDRVTHRQRTDAETRRRRKMTKLARKRNR